MRNIVITRGTIVAIVILIISSCDGRYASRDEAQKASEAWIKQGGRITVFTRPNDNEIKAQWRRERIAENNRCEFAKQDIEHLERTVPPDNFEENEIQAQYKTLITTRDKACSDRQILINTTNLTERQVINKRACKDDKRSMQFICTEKNAQTNEISRKNWDAWPKANHNFSYR